jgi:hypothetical protein
LLLEHQGFLAVVVLAVLVVNTIPLLESVYLAEQVLVLVVLVELVEHMHQMLVDMRLTLLLVFPV